METTYVSSGFRKYLHECSENVEAPLVPKIANCCVDSVTTPDASTDYVLGGLRPDSEYTIAIRAHTKYGDGGQISDSLQIVTMEAGMLSGRPYLSEVVNSVTNRQGVKVIP